MAATDSVFSKLILAIAATCILTTSFAQRDTSRVDTKRLWIISGTAGAAYTGSMIALGHAWYSKDTRTSFHFFNDAKEWKQMDKAGHLFSAFHISAQASQLLKSCNLPSRKSDRIGALTGFVILSSIEIFDGYSASYGASVTDVVANATGSLFFVGQSLWWNDVRIRPKFSWHHTSFAAQRPNVLGDGLSEVLKDYNGQSYWLSFDMKKFMPQSRWPSILNLAAGYGVNNMVYARTSENRAAGYEPTREFYLSVDLNLEAIQVESKFLKGLLRVANVIKVPAPTIVFSKNKVGGYWLYF